MKRVAIIAADFVPSSLPPALRIRFFANHLSEFGWHPTVISTEPEFYDYPVDIRNNDLLSTDVKVVRTPAMSVKSARRLGFGCVGFRSLRYHWEKLVELHHQQPFDLLFISVPPYFSILLGRLCAMRLKIPYVIDFIDPWVTDYYWTVRPEQRPPRWRFYDKISRILEPIALKSVAQITAVSSGTMDPLLKRYKWFHPSQMTEIPYGIEPDDFTYLRNTEQVNSIFDPDDGYLHMTYPGTFNVSRHKVTRAIFAAIKKGLEHEPERFKRLRLHFIGTTYDPKAADKPENYYQVVPLAVEAGIAELVDEHPARVSYLESLKLLIDSHALLLLGADETHYTASKLFPFMLAQRPLLAVFHESSSVVKIVKETDSGQVLSFSDLNPIEKQVDNLYHQISKLIDMVEDRENYRPTINWDQFEEYTARAMSRRLAEVFEKSLT